MDNRRINHPLKAHPCVSSVTYEGNKLIFKTKHRWDDNGRCVVCDVKRKK